jgi:hypothetical protein
MKILTQSQECHKVRKLVQNQPEYSHGEIPLGLTPIKEIEFDSQCRDEVTKTLHGLQALYKCSETRAEIFAVLQKMVPVQTKGRTGMPLWSIFVLGMLRLVTNCDYDILKDYHDNHMRVRGMMGLGVIFDVKIISLQSVQDNVSLFTEDVAIEINKIVVGFGHKVLFPGKSKALHARCDSFVFLSNVHFPTDLNLLKDCVRKSIDLCTKSAKELDLPGWREHISLVNNFRATYNTLTKMRYSNSKKEHVKEARVQEIHSYVKLYLNQASSILQKADDYQEGIDGSVPKLQYFLDHATMLEDQIDRRVLKGETILAKDKIYSVFEPYTEWICKGKAGVRQELGVKVCIVEDQFGFILNHRVMKNEQDADVAYPMVDACKNLYPQLSSVSFDKGFHSLTDSEGQNNRTRIEGLNVTPFIPVKGRRNKKIQAIESSEEFGKARKQHPAVESAINALENHGLDRCPDRGEENYTRYVAMAITASNIHRVGALLMRKELEKERRKKRRQEKKKRVKVK